MPVFDEVNGKEFDAVVIGTGFGGSVAVTRLASFANLESILVIERGTWWGNPEGPGLRTQRKPGPKLPGQDQRQWWPRPNDSRGVVYVLDALYKEINPIVDLINPFVEDNDLGMRQNRKGLYRLTRFSDENGKVDVISGSGVGGGSLFYSGVDLIPTRPVLDRIGLGHLASDHFRQAGDWMGKFRGRINKINTKVPVPHRAPEVDEAEYQLAAVPESGDPEPVPAYEMPDPVLPAYEEDYLLLDRARVLKRAKARVESGGGFEVRVEDAVRTGEASPFRPLPLSVVEYDPEEASSEERPFAGNSNKKHAFCLREGRCINGCLPSARHTLYKTLENLAAKGDGQFTVCPQTKVSHLSRRQEGGYTIHFESYLEEEGGRPGRVHAKAVFLGAGCLGTTEILLRSRAVHEEEGGLEGLPLPDTVGTHFSTNADFFSFATGVGDPDDTSPDSERIGKPNPTVGPINSSGFHVVFEKEGSNRVEIHVEDAGIPSMFARFIHEILPALEGDLEALGDLARAFVRTLLQKVPFADAESPHTDEREQEDYQTERELVSDVFFFNAMGAGPNEPYGTFYLDDLDDHSTMELEWEQPLHEWSVFRHLETVLGQLAEKMNGKHVTSPFWRTERRITVAHPLGGCPIGADKAKGAVDRHGRIYDGSPGAGPTDVLEHLYVVDAAAIPGALGVNPTFTIVTQALQTMDNAEAEL